MSAITNEADPHVDLSVLAGRTVVVKFGGNAMVDEALKNAFAAEIVGLVGLGINPVVVHGGGPQISEMLSRFGVETQFKAGLRVTTEEALQVVRMVLVGQVQRDLVNAINRFGDAGVGMSGEDGNTLICQRHEPVRNGTRIDVGFVGDVCEVDTSLITELVANKRIPVVSSIGVDRHGQAFNVNADIAAGALAGALHAARLVMMTDVAGLYRDWPTSTEVVREISAAELRELVPTLDGGMIPKMQACLTALAGGVEAAHVVDGRLPGAVVRALAGAAAGTTVTSEIALNSGGGR